MKSFIVSALILVGFSWTSALASEVEIASTLEKIETSASPEQILSGHLHQLLNLYLVGSHHLQQFDHELDAALANAQATPAGVQSPTYSELLVNWDAQHHSEDLLVGLYEQMGEKLIESTTPTPERQILRRVFANFKAELQALHGADQIAAFALYRRLQESPMWSSEFLSVAGLDAVHGQQDPLRYVQKYLRDPAAWARHVASYRQELAVRAEMAQAQRDPHLQQESQSTARELQAIFRQATSVRFAPGTGAGGNLSGTEFPNGYWALTFDDGPSLAYTPQVLANLQNHNMEATFFWLAQSVTGGTAIRNVVNSVGQAGFPREDHSWSHPQLTQLGATQLNHEVADSKVAEEGVYGTAIQFFRCPYGAGVSVNSVRSVIAANGMIHVLWNVDSLDWQDHDPASILTRVQKQMQLQRHGIILFHDIHPQSVQASNMLMDFIQQHNASHPPDPITLTTLPKVTALLNGGK